MPEKLEALPRFRQNKRSLPISTYVVPEMQRYMQKDWTRLKHPSMNICGPRIHSLEWENGVLETSPVFKLNNQTYSAARLSGVDLRKHRHVQL